MGHAPPLKEGNNNNRPDPRERRKSSLKAPSNNYPLDSRSAPQSSSTIFDKFFSNLFLGNLGNRLGDRWPIGVFMSNDGGLTWTKVIKLYIVTTAWLVKQTVLFRRDRETSRQPFSRTISLRVCSVDDVLFHFILSGVQ